MKIGKDELIKWIRTVLKRPNFEFSNLKDGDIYLELFEYIWPYAMKKYKSCIYINPINDINKKKNWNLIKTILNNVNIDINFINYDEICKNNFIECYQSLIILYFLYFLVKNKECDFILAYPINKELTNFMSSDKPLKCLVNSKSVKLSECAIENKQHSQLDNLIDNKMDHLYTNHINYMNEYNNKKTEKVILNSNIFTNNNESQINGSSIFNSDFMHSQNHELTKSFYSQELKKKVEDYIAHQKIKEKFSTNLDHNYIHKPKQNNPCNDNLFFYNPLKDYQKSSTISNLSSSIEKSEITPEKSENHFEHNKNYSQKTKGSLLLDKIYYNETKENEKKINPLQNFNDIEQVPKSNFFKYFNIGQHIEEENKNSNLILQNLEPPFPASTESSPLSNLSKFSKLSRLDNLEKGNKLNLASHKIDASSQTNQNGISNILLTTDEMNSLEVVWSKNSNYGDRVQSDNFIEYLKRQIKIYKKELDIKTNELELTKKIHEKEIKDIKEAHNLDLLNLKEKHDNEILYLKNENIEKIISIKKKFEHKLNNIEDDLLLDLDVLIFENYNVIDSSEHAKKSSSKTQITKQINEFPIHSNVESCFDIDNPFEQSDELTKTDNDEKDNNNNVGSENLLFNFTGSRGDGQNEKGNEIKDCNDIVKVNRTIQMSIKKVKHLVREKNKENKINNEYINNQIVNLKNTIKNNNLEKIKNYNNLEQNKEIFQELLNYIEDILTKNGNTFYDIDKEESYLKQIKNTLYNIIKNKKSDIKNDEIYKLLDKSIITRLITHVIFFLVKENIKTQNIKLNIMKSLSLNEYAHVETSLNKKIKLFETVEKQKDDLNSEQLNIPSGNTTILPSNEIIEYEKEIEKYKKIKNLEKKNKKLLSINEYYKKKLGHTEIWKKSIENLKKKFTHEKEDTIVEPSKERTKSDETEKNYLNQLNLEKHTFAEFPKFYLKIFDERNESDAELMFLLKQLDRRDNEPNEFNIFDNHTTEIYNKINKLDDRKNEIDSDNIFLNKNKIEIDELTETDNMNILDWEQNRSEKIKKKLTYLFWKMLGDIYKYRNIIEEAFNYVNNLNMKFNHYILENEERFKTSRNDFESFNQKNINLYLSDKYKLRKTIAIEKLNANIYKDKYIDLLSKWEAERKKYIFLINSCHENESVKYKYTINQLKNAYFNLKKYQIREKKWNQLSKLLATQINAPSTRIEHMIKDVWVEMLATASLENETENGTENEPNCALVKKKTNLQAFHLTEIEQDETNNDTYLLSLLENATQKGNLLKNTETPKKDKIKTTKLIALPQKITNKNNDKTIKQKNNSDQINKNKNNIINKKKSFFKVDNYNEQLNFYKYDFNTCLQNIQNNKIWDLSSENDDNSLDMCSDIKLANMEHCLDNVSLNQNEHLNVYNNECNVSETLYESNDLTSLSDEKKGKNNMIFLLSKMAKESCIMFQNILNIKEGELKEKEEKIENLEKQILELKQQNTNDRNNFQRLEDEQKNCEDQLSLLRDTIKYLNNQILLLNKEKLYLQINYLEKQKELENLIANYKHIFNQVKQNIQNYPLVLYLLEVLDETKSLKNQTNSVNPQEDNDIADKGDVQFSFQTDKNKNEEMDSEKIRYDIKKDMNNSKIAVNFSNFTNPIFDEQNKNLPNSTLNDLINDPYNY
ncbi:calponin homology domain-containing protein, putative [Plasmodium vinckei brucechwatti]|uniref:Calponin homology domain-containing protein, putative n=1 Tax=Plasmodium vinckei brucechwatti TaxID=119398 RepID=A0A6V7SLY5_PLAVN|nr:calponin homology domain-containing protein, putative [Plasmodium vinckei brucechwatti]